MVRSNKSAHQVVIVSTLDDRQAFAEGEAGPEAEAAARSLEDRIAFAHSSHVACREGLDALERARGAWAALPDAASLSPAARRIRLAAHLFLFTGSCVPFTDQTILATAQARSARKPRDSRPCNVFEA